MTKERNTKKSNSTSKKKDEVADLFVDIQNDNQSDNVFIYNIKKETFESGNVGTLEESKTTFGLNQNKNNKLFSFDKKIYFQIHKGNLYSIFTSGLIFPAKYSTNRAFTDIQNAEENALIFANGNIDDLNETQIILEINIKPLEQKAFQIFDSVAVSQLPLPISRIIKIHVSNDSVKKDIVQTSLTADGGIIPEQLIISSFPKELLKTDYSKSNLIFKNYSLELQRFDKILGAFAYLKNFSWLTLNRTNQLNIIPEHFFYMANAISTIPDFQKHKNERATLFYKQLFGISQEIEKPFLKWIFERLNIPRNFTETDTKEFGTIFLENIQNKDFAYIAKNLLIDLSDSIKRKKTIQEIWQHSDSDKSFLYLFSFLRNYGNANTEDKSTSRIDIPNIITTDSYIGEYIFACLGYFYGYSALRNFEEKIKLEDKYFADFTGLSKPLNLKFGLSTLFDYAIIESVYELVFHNNSTSSSFEFLKSNSMKNEYIRRGNNFPPGYTFSNETVLGKFNYTLKKESRIDDVDLSNKIPEITPVISELGVYLLRNGINKNWINFNELILNSERWRFIVFFKREQIIEAIQANKITQKELLQRIEISKYFKEF